MTRLRALRLTRAPQHLARAGLLWWARGQLGRVLVDGLAVRATRSGRLVVTWPSRRDAGGREHRLFWPIDRAVRDAVRAQVLAEVRRRSPAHQEPHELARALGRRSSVQSAVDQGSEHAPAQLRRGDRHATKGSAP